MRTSADWLRYFEQNSQSLLEIPWHAGPELTAQERLRLGHSVQEFQRGESSEGRHFLRYAEQYAATTGDRDYVSALRLFIAEEQRHARDLGRFLAINRIPLVASTLPDRVFRMLRHLLGSLEMSIAVLITAEIIAEVYYTALRAATDSVILERLCEQILRDEASHVEFQAEQLAKLRASRGQLLYGLTVTAQRLLFLGTCLVVWVFHRYAFEAGGQNFGRFWHSAWFHFERAFASSSRSRRLQAHEAAARVIDWQKLLATPYGARLDTLCAHPELIHHGYLSRRYRTAPNQYLDVFEDLDDGQWKYCGFAWVASEGAARIVYLREGSTEVGLAELPPTILLPRPGVLSVEEVAEYGSRTEPESFSRYVDLTHQVSFGDFRYHYRMVSPRPSDVPIAIQVHRDSGDPMLRQKLGPIEGLGGA